MKREIKNVRVASRWQKSNLLLILYAGSKESTGFGFQKVSQVTNTQLDITLPWNSAAQTINYFCIEKKKTHA